MAYQLTNNKYLLDQERDELVRILEKFKDQDPRNCTMLWLLLHTGGRASEILNLTRKDFNEIEGTVYIRGIKGSNDRQIPLPEWLARRVSELTVGIDGRLFPIQYNQMRNIWTLYRPVNKKLHSLRHTFAVNFYSRARDLVLLQRALGHRSIGNTLIYLDYAYSTAEFRKALFGQQDAPTKMGQVRS